MDGDGRYEGYLVVNGALQALPVGAFLDTQKGSLYWLPGPSFIGTYEFLFVRSAGGVKERIPVSVTVGQ